MRKRPRHRECEWIWDRNRDRVCDTANGKCHICFRNWDGTQVEPVKAARKILFHYTTHK